MAAFVNAPERQLYPDKWSEYGGVGRYGSQAGSPMVFALPSLSPCRIAVIGRQKPQYTLSFQQLMMVSAVARCSIAKYRACSTSVSFCSTAIVRNPRTNNSNALVS